MCDGQQLKNAYNKIEELRNIIAELDDRALDDDAEKVELRQKIGELENELESIKRKISAQVKDMKRDLDDLQDDVGFLEGLA